MKITMTVTRVFEMDESRLLAERDFDPPSADADKWERQAWLEESFFELCGFERDQDHIDGSYVKRLSSDAEIEFGWPKGSAVSGASGGEA